MSSNETVTTTSTDSTTGTTTTVVAQYSGIIVKLGGRKFFLTLLIFAFTCVALAWGWLNQETFKSIAYAILGIYVGGNVAQKYSDAITQAIIGKLSGSSTTTNP